MKLIYSGILLFLLAFQVFLKIGIIGYYGINKDYITAHYCVNRSHPQMHCNGKCYLKKQLDKADNASKQPQEPQKDKTEGQPFIRFTDVPASNPNVSIVNFSDNTSTPATRYPGRIFHPPTV